MEGKEQRQTQARLQAIVHGRVQGVSFRYYTQRRASEMGLVGYVRNVWSGPSKSSPEDQEWH